MSDRPTPETEAETMQDEYDHVDSDIGPFIPSKTVCADFARKLERERDEAREALSEIAFCLSVGMGDETTTAQQYIERIQEGIKMLTEPIVTLWKQAELERDEAREELARIESLLLDPHAVFLNFLRGKIAKLDWEKLEHIHGPHPARVERDEARESLKHITEYGTEEINAAVELRQKLAQTLIERDEAIRLLKLCADYTITTYQKKAEEFLKQLEEPK